MKKEQRQVIHELAECYGVETESQDEEPYRNVVARATKSVDVLLKHLNFLKSTLINIHLFVAGAGVGCLRLS